jgi:hypothetical protein
MTDYTDRIEVTELTIVDNENDLFYRRWMAADGTVIKEECVSPSPVRVLKWTHIDTSYTYDAPEPRELTPEEQASSREIFDAAIQRIVDKGGFSL